MQISLLTALLAVGAELVAAGPLVHRHSGGSQKRQLSSLLSTACSSKLGALGVVSDLGLNALASGSSPVWVGDDGSYTNLFTNHSPHEICLVLWGDEPAFQSSFVGTIRPLITVALPAHGGNTTLSFAEGSSGAWAGVYPDTLLSTWGQISNTWGEFTMSPEGVVDVSREVFTQGNRMRIVGPDCTTDMERCVFTCADSSATTCGDAGSYQLLNCAPGSQTGAQSSSDSFDGGCGWNGKSNVNLRTYFH